MKVVVDARYLGRPGVGINTYLMGLISVLRDARAEVIYIVDKVPSYFIMTRREKLVVLPPAHKLIWEQHSIPRFLRSTSADIYIAPANTGLPLFARKRGMHYLLVVHDFIPLRFPSIYLIRRPLFAITYIFSVLVSVLRADVILANSEFSAAETNKLFHKRATNAYIPVTYAPYAGIQPKLFIAKYGKYFVYNGGADTRKNVAELFRGFSLFEHAHSGYQLLVLGNGYDSLKKIVQDEQLEHIRFLGYVSDADKVSILAGAQANVCLSKMEGFGLPIIESFSAGTPVITTRNSALAEIGGDAVLYVEQSSALSLARSLSGFVGLSKVQIVAMKRRGYARLVELNNFNSGAIIADTLRRLA